MPKYTIVFIHGFLDDSTFWNPTIRTLEARNLSAVTVDLPGMGKAADDPGPFSLDRLANAVASVVDAIGQPTVLVGHSMGAQVAELVARMRRWQIAGLVLLTPVPLGGLAVPESTATALRNGGGNREAQREGRIKYSSHLTAADLDHAVEVAAKVRPETRAALFEAWSGGHDAGLVPSVVNVPPVDYRRSRRPFRDSRAAQNRHLSSLQTREQRIDFERGSLATP